MELLRGLNLETLSPPFPKASPSPPLRYVADRDAPIYPLLLLSTACPGWVLGVSKFQDVCQRDAVKVREERKQGWEGGYLY